MTEKRVGLTPNWVSTAPLHTVCVRIADIHLHDKDSVGGDILAIVTKRIIAAEVTPGGPYRNSKGSPDLKTNLAINYMFTSLGRPLPNVVEFIETHRHTAPKDAGKLLEKYDRLVARPSKVALTHNQIYDNVRASIEQLPTPLNHHGRQFLDRVQRADVTREISHISSFFESSLRKPQKAKPTKKLGEANVYCWVAYMLYDHIIDGETTVYRLPIANVAMRKALEIYQSLFPKKHPFYKVISRTFTDMDFANAWEVDNTRAAIKNKYITIPSMPDYGDFSVLSKRSFGHALGPMALSYMHRLTTDKIDLVERGLQHYLVARQLNDDLHDWKDDLKKGHLSAVVTQLLKDEHIDQGLYKLDSLSSRLQTVFWSNSMEEINNTIKHHVDLSLDFVTQTNLFKEDSNFLKLITKQREIALGSSKEHDRYRSFASTYAALDNKAIL